MTPIDTRDIGTITWFKCGTKIPKIDPQDSTYEYSVLCLLYNEKHGITTGLYWAAMSIWLHNDTWQPTSWAYINYPE